MKALWVGGLLVLLVVGPAMAETVTIRDEMEMSCNMRFSAMGMT